ncbi:MAG: hypothetical protein QOH23_2510, partial [Gaiellaceae bacterium]|nr:hypothetical protein [Gaiellaceae bacterium]
RAEPDHADAGDLHGARSYALRVTRYALRATRSGITRVRETNPPGAFGP